MEEGEKIKDETNPTANSSGTLDHGIYLDTLAKVVQSVYTQINSWRERMPNKNEDLTVWHSILGQRNMIYENTKKKISVLYDNVISTANNINASNIPKPDKLLFPYTDIEWNNLKLRKQKRKYGLFVPDKNATTTLFLDEYVVKEK